MVLLLLLYFFLSVSHYFLSELSRCYNIDVTQPLLGFFWGGGETSCFNLSSTPLNQLNVFKCPFYVFLKMEYLAIGYIFLECLVNYVCSFKIQISVLYIVEMLLRVMM